MGDRDPGGRKERWTRWTDQEWDQVKAAAKERGETVNEFVRGVVFAVVWKGEAHELGETRQ